MNPDNYLDLLERHLGYLPGVDISASEAAGLSRPPLVRDEQNRDVLPFGALVLPFHEAVFATTDGVHEFIRSHFTRRLRDLTQERALFVRACAVSGWTVLEQMSRKGLIVDLTVRLRVLSLIQDFPSPLRFTAKPHILRASWHFVALAPNHRRALAQHLEALRPQASSVTPHFKRFEGNPRLRGDS